MELNEKDIELQAEQFIDYSSKFKVSNLSEIFRGWCESKGFDKETEKAIHNKVNTIIEQRKRCETYPDARVGTEKPHLSFTQINMFLRCGRQYEYRYVQGIKRPPSGALILGKSWHMAVEHNYKQKIQTEQDLPLEDVQDCFSDAFDQAFTEEVELNEGENPSQLKDTGILVTATHHKIIAPTVQPAEVEKEFNLSLGEEFPFFIKGFWDVIDKNGITADNKSYSKSPAQSDVDKDLQLTLYSTAYRAIYQKIEPELRLDCIIKTKTPKAVQISSTRTNEDCKWFLGLVEKVAQAIESGIFYPNPNHYLCSPKWCGYYSRCHERK